MKEIWNKGHTKENNLSVQKISATMKLRKIDNFKAWREKMRLLKKIPDYQAFSKNADLAELMGVVLGDGHIWPFPRTDELSIFSNSNNPGFIKHYGDLVERIFNKKPTFKIHSGKKCVRIRIYQKYIAERLGVPYSPRGKKKIQIPDWILENKEYIVRYLRGLYEAEGSISHHEGTYTHKFLFSNRNKSMLENVFKLLTLLGYHPHRGTDKIQLSRQDEIEKIVKEIKFRKY